METIDFSKVGLKMKELRMEQGATQEKIADALECTVAFISNIENNRAKLNLRVLLYYANLCNVSVDTFLDAGRSGVSVEKEAAQEAELLRVFQTFTLEERDKIIKIMKLWKKTEA